MLDVKPFRIDIAQDEVDGLRRRIRETHWADDFCNDDWEYGVERGWLRDMAHYWAEDFDWREQEKAINSLAHFKTEIDGIAIHFMHVKGKGPSCKPLILTHGWPWTFWDWKDMIGPLTDPAAHGGDAADAFDLVIPSIPGFGFSSPLRTAGVNLRRVAELWTKLMHGLGYARFGAAGGDFGAVVTGEMGHAYPQNLIGAYMTLLVLPGIDAMASGLQYAPNEAWMVQRAAEAMPAIISHITVHRSDPQTLSYALTDSPVGLAAWIWERRRAWSDCGGDVIGLYGRDFLCTNVSLYWFTKTIGTSMRFYKENSGHRRAPALDRQPLIPVPTGFGVAPKDVLMMPRALAEAKTNLHRWTVFPRGGHFGPAEIPLLLAGEYREFFRALR